MLPELGLVVSLLLLILGSLGIPVGTPPTPEDPLLAKVAPAECVFYTSWAGTAKPDPASANSTEKLLADPEMARIKEFAERAVASLSGGAGGEPGPQAALAMSFAKRITSKPTAIFVESIALNADGSPPRVKAAIITRQDADAAAMAADWVAFLPPPAKQVVKQVTLAAGARQITASTTTGPAGEPVTWCIVGNYFILAQGQGTIEGILARAAGQPPAFMADLDKGAPAKRVVSRSYLNLAGIKKAVGSELLPQADAILKSLGLDQMQGLYGVCALDDQGFVSRSWITHAAPPGGLFKGLGGAPLTAADLAAIPADATFALVARADADQGLISWLAFLGQVEPRAKADIERDLAMAQQQLGLDPRADLLQTLGPTWRIYSSPTDGGLPGGASLVVDVKDAAKLQATITKLVAVFNMANRRGPAPPGEFEGPAPKLETTKIGAAEVYTLSGLPIPAAPTFGIVGGKFIVAASPIAVRNFATRDAAFVSLAANPDVKKALGTPGPTALAYVDMKQVVDTYGPLLPAGIQLAARQLPGAPDFGKPPAVENLAVHMRPTVVAFTATDRTWEWTSRQTLPGADLARSLPITAALVLPAVQAARAAAQRMQSANNLKQIGLALHNYHATHGKFPPAYTVDKNGKPLHSWRTLILPYLEQQALFDRIKFDEPWDSEHNQKFLKSDIVVYMTPSVALPPGQTLYLGIGTADGIFNPGGKGRDIAEIRDGTSNTILVVEAGREAAVPWGKPADFTPDEKNVLKGLGGNYAGGFHAAFADGSVHFISAAVDPKLLKALFTISGGEVIDHDALHAPPPGAPRVAPPGAVRPDFNLPHQPKPDIRPAPPGGAAAPPGPGQLDIFAGRDAALRRQAENNLKQIALAVHTYASTHGKLPPAFSVDAQGKPLHSWRTLILPYLEQNALYQRLKLDEPWDSPHNRQIFEKLDEFLIFGSPGLSLKKNHTVLLAIRTKDSIFPADGKPRRLADIRDGLSNTVLVVEAEPSASVPWYKPDDFEPGDKFPFKGLTAARRGGFLAALGDGSVRFIDGGVDDKTLHALITANGGEVIDSEELDGPRHGAPRNAPPRAGAPDFIPPPRPAPRPALPKAG